MGRQRRAEDLPRLMAALGLDEATVRSRVDAAALTPREQAGLEFWLPTEESIVRAADGPLAGSGPGAERDGPGGPGSGGSPGPGRTQALRPSGPGGRHRPGPRVLAAPAALRGARRVVPLRAVVVVVVVVVLAGMLFAVRVMSARAAGAPRAVATADVAAPTASGAAGTGVVVGRTAGSFGPPGGAGDPPGGAGAPARGGPAPASGASVVVHVVGLVARPGVVSLPSGSRVGDAVKAAGGARAGADLSALNLARVLADGEQIRVPRPGEQVTAASSAAVAPGAPAGAAGVKVNLNTADLTALDGLPGVGPVLAQRILDWRSAHGRFSSVEELGEVSGIGEKLLAQLTPKVTL